MNLYTNKTGDFAMERDPLLDTPAVDKRLEDKEALKPTANTPEDDIRFIQVEFLQIQPDTSALVAFDMQTHVLKSFTDEQVLDQMYLFGRKHLTNVKWQSIRFKGSNTQYIPEVEPVIEE